MQVVEAAGFSKSSARKRKVGDNRCSDKAVRYWQCASAVVEECGEHTINTCQQCYNEQLVQQGKPRLNSWQWRAMREIMENEQFIRGMWKHFTLKRAEAKKILEDAGSRSLFPGRFWSRSGGLQTMRKGNIATRSGSWEEFKEGCREKEITRMDPRENMRSLRESGER